MQRIAVLILVLMEVALGELSSLKGAPQEVGVLILVLVEVALGGILVRYFKEQSLRLNPYFSGSCSWRL